MAKLVQHIQYPGIHDCLFKIFVIMLARMAAVWQTKKAIDKPIELTFRHKTILGVVAGPLQQFSLLRRVQGSPPLIISKYEHTNWNLSWANYSWVQVERTRFKFSWCTRHVAPRQRRLSMQQYSTLRTCRNENIKNHAPP